MGEATRTTPTAGRERRRFPRARFDGLVAIESNGKLFTANVAEVSEGGLRLEAAWLDPEAENVTVQLPLRGRFGRIDQCALRGSVVRRRGEMVGVRFAKLLPRHKLQLRDFVYRAQPHY